MDHGHRSLCFSCKTRGESEIERRGGPIGGFRCVRSVVGKAWLLSDTSQHLELGVSCFQNSEQESPHHPGKYPKGLFGGTCPRNCFERPPIPPLALLRKKPWLLRPRLLRSPRPRRKPRRRRSPRWTTQASLPVECETVGWGSAFCSFFGS